MLRRLSSALVRGALFVVLVVTVSLVVPSDSSAVDCSSHCQVFQCQRCFVDYQLQVTNLMPHEEMRVAINQPFGFSVLPDHWGQSCFNVTFEDVYQIDVIVGYTHEWAGAEFEIYMDGVVVGRTQPVGGGWGFPIPPGVPSGHEVGRVSFLSECERTYKIELRETTYQSHGFQEACDKRMLSVGVILRVEMRRLQNATVPPERGILPSEPSVATSSAHAGAIPAAPLRVSDAWPNPGTGNQSFQVSFDSPAGTGSMASMSVHDVSGRLVRRLPDRWISTGDSRVQWDGKDATGRQVVPGVYFVRVRAAGLEATARSIRSLQGPSGTAPLAQRLPAPPATTQPLELPPDDEGGGSPPDTVAMMNAIIPFLQYDAIGDSLKLDVAGAQASGVTAAAIEIGKDLFRAVNRTANHWIDHYLVPAARWAEPHLGQTDAIDALQVGCRIDELPCNTPGTHAYPNNECPFTSKAAVQNFLVQEGYHAVNYPYALLGDTYHGVSYARDICGDPTCPHPGNSITCPCGLLRKEAKIQATQCGCWTYVTHCPEPDPEPLLINNDPVLTALWLFHVKLWHSNC